MPSKREQSQPGKDRDRKERLGDTPPPSIERDPNEIARFERPFERFDDLEEWQQPLRIDDDVEREESDVHDRLRVQPRARGQREERSPGRTGPIPKRSGSRTS